jgi:hypothetical protein
MQTSALSIGLRNGFVRGIFILQALQANNYNKAWFNPTFLDFILIAMGNLQIMQINDEAILIDCNFLI